VIDLPKQLKNITPEKLFWFRFNKVSYPCRVCAKEEAFGLGLPPWNEQKSTLVQDIMFPAGLGKFCVTSNGGLTPYFGKSNISNTWCQKRCDEYIQHLKKKTPNRYSSLSGSTDILLRAEIFLLEKILRLAKENASKLRREKDENALKAIEEKNENETEIDDDLDEPYTQDWGSSSNEDMSDDDMYASAVTLEPSRKKEPIRPGDVICYHSHMCVAGDKRGLRTTTVLSVDAKGDPILKLSNGEYLPKDTQIKRTQIMHRGIQEDHKGIFRPINYFKLKTNLNANIVIETETQRMSNILKKKMEDLKEKIKQEGGKSLPVDFLNSSNCKSNHKTKKSQSMPETQSRRKNPDEFQSFKTPSPRKRKRRRNLSADTSPSPEKGETENTQISSDGIEKIRDKKRKKSSPISGSLRKHGTA